MDELINMPIKAEEGSVIQISLRTQDLSEHKMGTIWNRRQKLQLIHDPQCFQKSGNPFNLPHKPTIGVLFKAKSTDPNKNLFTPSLDQVAKVKHLPVSLYMYVLCFFDKINCY